MGNRFRTRGSTTFRKGITEEFTVRPTALIQNMKKAGGFRVTREPGRGVFGMGFGIKASSKMIGIRYFRGTTQPKVATSKAARTRQRNRGLTITTRKGKPASRHKGAFVADLNGPKWFTRKGKPRLPLQRVFGPSLYSMYVRRQKEINNALAQTYMTTAKDVLKYHEQKLRRTNARL